MKSDLVLHCVDSHTLGEPTRVVVGGLPPVPGSSMAEKKRCLENSMDWYRKALLFEPRGHADMFGSIILPPIRPDASLGAVFMDSGGYLNMCGHASIGTVVVAIETGIVPRVEPVTQVTLDTPAGVITTRALVEQGRVKEITLRNVPAFVYRLDLVLDVDGVGTVRTDVAFGGNFFAIVGAQDTGLDLKPENSRDIIEVGLRIKKAVNASITVRHPTEPHIASVDLVEFYGDPVRKDAHLRSAVVFGAGSIDRSPCGTGTCAKMAVLHARGELGIGEEFRYESIIGTLFKGCLVGVTNVGEFPAVIPEITGSGYITGFHQFLFDPDDPLKDGFLLA